MNKLDDVTKDLLKKDIPGFTPGDTISLDIRVVEGEKERVQRYQGVVLARKHGGIEETITVRKISNGIGVERIFAKLHYLRSLTGKAARITEKR